MQAQQTLKNASDRFDNRDQFGNQIDPNMVPENLQDSTNTELVSLAPKLYMWKLSELLGERTIMPADTANLNFQNSNLTYGMNGEYNYLGNLGSPRMSRIFFNRKDAAPTIFMQPFSSFYVAPDEVKFTNSNIPYTNLSYYNAGNKINGEEEFKSYFSLNVNKRLAFGFNIDYQYGRGYYQKQSVSNFNGGFFGSYIGEKYQLQAVMNSFNMKMNENGGITNDQYITRPENMAAGKKEYESTTIPVNLDQAANRNNDIYFYLTHRYRLGFYRDNIEIKDKPNNNMGIINDSLPTPKDTIITEEFIPVTSFIHTFNIERSRHEFRAKNEPAGFFPSKYYLDKSNSNDSTTALSVRNTLGVALLEGFNKYAKAGLTAYITHRISRYDLMNVDSINTQRPIQRYTEQEVYVGGELAKRQGKLLHYNVNGEVGILDKAIGQFQVNGNLDLNFRLRKDTVTFLAKGYIKNTLPSFYMRHYHSNHYTWDYNMKKEFRARIEGQLNVKRWRTNLRAGIENIKNYTYFNQQAMPEQCGDNIQVLSAILKQDFKLGIFHLDNEVAWQKSSNETVLPLPQLSLYHNLYLLTKIAKKVLTVQLGAELAYFTKYYAPAYAPGIQQFHLQPTDDQVEIGGYPFVNVYVNMHLKRTRIYVMASNLMQGMGNRAAFTVPHYPVNPRQWFRFGISWNFYD